MILIHGDPLRLSLGEHPKQRVQRFDFIVDLCEQGLFTFLSWIHARQGVPLK